MERAGENIGKKFSEDCESPSCIEIELLGVGRLVMVVRVHSHQEGEWATM